MAPLMKIKKTVGHPMFHYRTEERLEISHDNPF